MDAEQITLTIAAGVSIIMLLPVLGIWVNMFPELWASLFRTAACIRIEDSRKVQRNRDLIFWMTLPALLTIVWHFDLYAPEWMSGLAPYYRILCTGGILAGYMLLRFMLVRLAPHRKLSTKTYEAASGSPRNFWLLLGFVLFFTTMTLSTLDVPETLFRIVTYCITSLLYLLFLIRRLQIFAYDCNYLTAILYLCALEILPTALLVTSAVVF